MKLYLYALLAQWSGLTALREEHALELATQAEDIQSFMDEADQLKKANQRLSYNLDAAHQRHLQDEAAIAMVAGQRWSAVSALVGGIEQLQHKWLDEAGPLPTKDPRRTCANELGGLKRSIQKQFGVHPSQAKKTAEGVLGRKPLGRLSQTASPHREATGRVAVREVILDALAEFPPRRDSHAVKYQALAAECTNEHRPILDAIAKVPRAAHLTLVKALRKETGASLKECDAALKLAKGDPVQAQEILRKQDTIHGYPHSLRTAVELAKEAGGF